MKKTILIYAFIILAGNSFSQSTLQSSSYPGLQLTHENSQIWLYGDGQHKWSLGSTGATGSDFIIYDKVNTNVRLSIDETSGNIGIGTTSPNAPLTITSSTPALQLTDTDGGNWDFYGYSNNLLIREGLFGSSPTVRVAIQAGGNVGIGKINPYAKLDVATGYVFFDVGNENRVVISDDDTDTNADSPKLSFFGRDYSGSHITGPSIQKINNASYGRGRLAIFQHGGADYTSEEEVMSILPDGKVGIGTINPQSLLAVNGTITTKEVVVTIDGWSDFVFNKDYKLKDLEEVESFIEENKHLPDIPSEKEVKENGIQVGEMNAKLLQKIEELTLYVIEQNKETKAMKAQLENLAEENNELKEEIKNLKETIQ